MKAATKIRIYKDGRYYVAVVIDPDGNQPKISLRNWHETRGDCIAVVVWRLSFFPEAIIDRCSEDDV